LPNIINNYKIFIPLKWFMLQILNERLNNVKR
jgi:hypothetical protein